MTASKEERLKAAYADYKAKAERGIEERDAKIAQLRLDYKAAMESVRDLNAQTTRLTARLVGSTFCSYHEPVTDADDCDDCQAARKSHRGREVSEIPVAKCQRCGTPLETMGHDPHRRHVTIITQGRLTGQFRKTTLHGHAYIPPEAEP